VRALLKQGWSPASIAGRLPIDYPGDHACRVSHEAIYQWIYAQPVATLARELLQLRTGRTARKGGRRPPPAPRITEPTYIDDRPADVAGRQVPGHWEGDLVIGKAGKTAVATLVERTSRFLVLVPLTGRDSLTVGRAVVAATSSLPAHLRASLTWDCGAEMAAHATVTKGSMPVYFAHPHSPWERGSNENLNRIVREYFPKGVEITADPKYLGSAVISTPLGKYSRTMRLRFSLLPRSHGEWGWAKYTGMEPLVTVACAAISAPQSQVREARRWAGRLEVAATTARPTVSESRPVSGTSTRKREVRSTSVATAVLPALPITRSPSQCPGTWRPATSAGRSSM